MFTTSQNTFAIYTDKHSTFYELLKKDCSVSLHTRNLQFLLTEMYKLAKGISTTTNSPRTTIVCVLCSNC